MNRRILLIDPDVPFRDLLVRELARYKVGVESVADGEQAVASAVAAPPALIVIAADEPDKHGFKTFQKCRKAVAKVPIAMVTGSVAPSSFKRHGEGKVHAELYLDKRELGAEELIAKLDGLIGLGMPEDDLAVPLEVDEIPLDIDGNDAVVDETVGDERGFDDPHSALTVGPPHGGAALRLDSQVDAELDATFAALLGDDSTAAPIVNEAVPEPLEPEPEPEPEEAQAAPSEVIHDSGHHSPPVEDEPPPAPADDAARDALAVVDELADEPAEEQVVAAPPVEESVAEADDDPRHEFDSSPSIALDVGDIESFEEEKFIELPIKQRFVEATTAVEAPPDPPAEPRPRILQARTGVDLGLDVLAEAAERDQSGVHDRRELRKLGELERQVAQLKVELERARHDASATPAAGGREREFLGLREQLATRDRELRELRDQLGARERVLADVRDELRQARTAHQTATARADELVHRVAALENAETAHRAATSELAAARRELDTRAAAAAAAEAARQQAERDVATERAARAASASEAERILRGERDQLVARHRAELDAERDRAATDREAALAQLRLEYDAVQADAIAAAVKSARAEADAEHARARAAADAEHARERREADAVASEQLARARSDADAAASELAAQLERVRSDAADAAADLQRRHDAELAAATASHAEQLAAVEQAAKAQLAGQAAQHRAALERAQAEALDAATSAAAEHANAIESLERDHAAALATREQAVTAQDRDHKGELEALAAARGRDAQAHAEAVAELRGQLDAVRAELDGARGELASQAEVHDAARTQLVTEHRASMDGALAAHEAALSRARSQGHQELERAAKAHAVELATAKADADKAAAVARADRDRAAADHDRALATARAEHDRALAAAETAHARATAELTGERDELRRGLSSARDALRRVEGELASAVQTTADRNAELRAHAAGIAERDQRIAELRREVEAIEAENAQYQEQVLRAYQRIKTDEATVARAKKALAIALTALDQPSAPNGPATSPHQPPSDAKAK